MNGTLVKNQLIFDFASGSLGPAKSIFAATYLYLNSKASNISRTFENILGNNLSRYDKVILVFPILNIAIASIIKSIRK